jgi:hypothetical protein
MRISQLSLLNRIITGKTLLLLVTRILASGHIWKIIITGNVFTFFNFFTLLFHYWCWTQDLTLAMQALYHLRHSTNPFLCWAFLR